MEPLKYRFIDNKIVFFPMGRLFIWLINVCNVIKNLRTEVLKDL